MEKKIVSPRIREDSKNWYGENFSNTNAGVVFILEAFPDLYRRTLLEMKGRFSRAELSLFLDLHNAYMMTPGFLGVGLEAQVSDGIALDGLDKKWLVDKQMVLEKIQGLNSFQAATLEIWATNFWQSSQKHWEKKDGFEKYVEAMV